MSIFMKQANEVLRLIEQEIRKDPTAVSINSATVFATRYPEIAAQASSIHQLQWALEHAKERYRTSKS